MTKSGRAEKSRTLFAHAVLAQIKEEKLIQSHFTDDDRPNPPRVRPPQRPPVQMGFKLKLEKLL